MILMIIYWKWYLVNFVFLVFFIVCISFVVGLSCLMVNGLVMLEVVVIMMVVVLGFIFYIFWVVKSGYEFEFLGLFLVFVCFIFMFFFFLWIIFLLGSMGIMVYGCIVVFVFFGFIIYDIDNFISVYFYDEYVVVVIEFYFDIINFF